MIKIALDVFFAWGALLILFSFGILWALGEWCKRGADKDFFMASSVKQCPYCGNICLDDQEREFIECTVCRSLLETGERNLHENSK